MEKDSLKLKPTSQRRNPNERMQWWRLASLVLLAVVSVLSGYQGYSQKPIIADSYEQLIVREDRPGEMTPSYPSAKLSLAGDKDNEPANAPLANYRATLNLLKKSYYGAPLDKKQTRRLTYEAIRGMIYSLKDQFSSFLDPDDWSQMIATTEGDFEGIGALLIQERDRLKVVRPIEGSPAEFAGIKADDYIVSVDGEEVTGKTLNDVVRKIKGKEGTKVKVGFLHGTVRTEATLTRALVEPPVVQFWMESEADKIGHIVLNEFNEKSVPQLQKAYEKLSEQGMKGLVFDVRYNPGGLLESAVDITSLFVPKNLVPELKNVVVYTVEGDGKEKEMRLRTPEFVIKRIPTVLLVNGSTASAAEIVSGALKDYGIATLIGERTYGKGRVQTLYPLEDGSALRLTTSLYYPPLHYDLNFERDDDGAKREGTGGILPDIELKQSPNWRAEDFKDKANDTQLLAAIRFLQARLNGKTISEAQTEIKTQN